MAKLDEYPAREGNHREANEPNTKKWNVPVFLTNKFRRERWPA